MNSSQILAKMQGIDDKISDLLKKSAHLPEQLKGLQDKKSETGTALDELVEQIKKCKESQSLLELEVQTNKNLVEKYKEQLNSISNNKEYKALNSEITLIKSKNVQLDEKELGLMEEEKLLNEQKRVAEENNISAKKALEEGEATIKVQIDEVNKQIEAEKSERNALAGKLPTSLVKQYVLLIKKKNRKAVAFAYKDACSECGFRLRPQLLLELDTCSEPKVCENCGRFLIKLEENK